MMRVKEGIATVRTYTGAKEEEDERTEEQVRRRGQK